jgi:leucyl-tRNA synthetase
VGGPADPALRREVHQNQSQANYDIQRHQFNTVASACMKILNALERADARGESAREGLSILLRLLSPIAPHISHHLWQALGFGGDVMRAAWPEADPAALEQDELEYVVQVNGVKRGTVRAPKAADRTALEAIVRSLDFVKRHIADRIIKKIVIVPGRLINVVV